MSTKSAVQPEAESTIAEGLAEFAAGLRFEDVPGEVIARAKLHILDTLGTALALIEQTLAMTSKMESLKIIMRLLFLLVSVKARFAR